MRPWTFPVPLSSDLPEPLFLQIAQAISRDIQRGRLKSGAALPGSRTLARDLGVHRNTVLAAYRELSAEGWILGEGRATRVTQDVPAASEPGLYSSSLPGYDLAPSPETWSPSSGNRAWPLVGTPDLRLFPAREFGQAFRRALRNQALLEYGDPRGNARLREALARLLSEMRGLASRPDQILVTAGSQMALTLIARTLVRPGDRVAIEDPGYPHARMAFQDAGARVVPVPIDAEGLRIDVLERIAETSPLRAVFVTPHHQYPTTVTMSAARRLRLLDLAARRRIAVVEDDYDFEFHYGEYPVMPLASRDPGGVVIYMGTLSKILAPGLRLGFVSAPQPVVDALASRRTGMDFQGNQIVEQAVADLLAEGVLQRHARKMRRVYAARRDALGKGLRDHLAGALSFELPSGGMSIWAQAAPEVDLEGWLDRARQRGLDHPAGQLLDFRGTPLQGLRLGFSRRNEEELDLAVRVLAETLA